MEGVDYVDSREKGVPALRTTLVDIFSGSIAGMSGLLVGSPFDLIKVRIQQNIIKGSVMDVVRETARKEGVRLLLSEGVVPPLCNEAYLNMVYFGVFSLCSRYLRGNNPSHDFNPGQALLAGCCAGVCKDSVSDLIKIHSQIDLTVGNNRRKPMKVIKDIYKSRGILGFTHGWTSVACRDVPGVGIYFGFYYFLRHCLSKEESHIPLFHQFLSGGVAGLLSWGLVYPFDVVKTRIQSNLTNIYYGVDCLLAS